MYEKRQPGNRSLSNTSARTKDTAGTNPIAFVIKHDSASTASGSVNRRSSKASSAPSSPTLAAHNRHSVHLDTGTATGTTSSGNKKLRSSLSSNRLSEGAESSRSNVKKKLAFSDDEILNPDEGGHGKEEAASAVSCVGGVKKSTGSKIKSRILMRPLQRQPPPPPPPELETDCGSQENVSVSSPSNTLRRDHNNRRSDVDVDAHKRSSSLTKSAKLSNYNISSGEGKPSGQFEAFV